MSQLTDAMQTVGILDPDMFAIDEHHLMDIGIVEMFLQWSETGAHCSGAAGKYGPINCSARDMSNPASTARLIDAS